MELHTQLKKYRTGLKLSQEELAEKIYVTRQTISNWENEKNYPDIHSLLLISSLFNVSLDQLIKGDIKTMKKEISAVEIEKLNRYGVIYSIFLIISIISAVPLFIWLGIDGIILEVILFGISLFFAYKVERIKKDNNIRTYKEIIAFTEGKQLDEIEQQREVGKRSYQSFLLALGCGFITLLVGLLSWLILK